MCIFLLYVLTFNVAYLVGMVFQILRNSVETPEMLSTSCQFVLDVRFKCKLFRRLCLISDVSYVIPYISIELYRQLYITK